MQSISPETIYRGDYAWEKSLPQIAKLTKSPLILGRGINTSNLRNKIFIDLKNQNLDVNYANYNLIVVLKIFQELRILFQIIVMILLLQLEVAKF